MASPSCEIVVSRRAEGDLRTLAEGDRTAAKRNDSAIAKIAADRRPSDVEKLRASQQGDSRRIAGGVHRVFCAGEDSRVLVEVVRIGHRREVDEPCFR